MMLNIALIQSKNQLVHISINMLSLKSKATIVDSHFTLWVLAGICILDGLRRFYTAGETPALPGRSQFSLSLRRQLGR